MNTNLNRVSFYLTIAISVFLWAPGVHADELIQGSDRDDYIVGTAGDDIIKGHRGNDLLNGENGDDRLFGNRGDDKIYGDAGDDLLVGGMGTNVLDGGIGYDTYVVSDKTDYDVIEEDAEFFIGANGVVTPKIGKLACKDGVQLEKVTFHFTDQSSERAYTVRTTKFYQWWWGGVRSEINLYLSNGGKVKLVLNRYPFREQLGFHMLTRELDLQDGSVKFSAPLLMDLTTGCGLSRKTNTLKSKDLLKVTIEKDGLVSLYLN